MGPAARRHAMKPVGEPDGGNRHVRFDERRWETERLAQPQATAPISDSTNFRLRAAIHPFDTAISLPSLPSASPESIACCASFIPSASVFALAATTRAAAA